LRRSLRGVVSGRGGSRPLSSFPPRETHWQRLRLNLHGMRLFLLQPGRERWDLWRLVDVRNPLRCLSGEQEQLLGCNPEGDGQAL
jgi:hypothetical protein